MPSKCFNILMASDARIIRSILHRGYETVQRFALEPSWIAICSVWQITAFQQDFKFYQKDKSLESKTGGESISTFLFYPTHQAHNAIHPPSSSSGPDCRGLMHFLLMPK